MIHVPLSSVPAQSSAEFTPTELDRLFGILIPTLPGSRFCFANGVLCDRGPDQHRPNFAIEGNNIIDQQPLRFFAVDTTSERKVAIAIDKMWEKEGTFGMCALNVGLDVMEAVRQEVLETGCYRVESSVALVLLLLERSFDCCIPPAAKWISLFKTILTMPDFPVKPVIEHTDLLSGKWERWVRQTVPARYNNLCYGVFYAASDRHRVRAPRVISTPPRVQLRQAKVKAELTRAINKSKLK
ncbi:hypothetical protein HD553DRAFT_317928 [Filobasidium floriforme]|uniref:uncharacterized protein n=1 Tax=Filobasidium floriforme TaxID=5210 RepID=UPI001E8CB978|nr:uncharacterized protein HD553DRAFT_317928 [Filobasidium floriforme]KAH8079913.1 hypothetical protein HD553DRAFT_317928 [Filobasidium floriforme]